MILNGFDFLETLRNLEWVGNIRVPFPENTEDWCIGDDYYVDPETHEPIESSIVIDLGELVEYIELANSDLDEVETLFGLAVLQQEKVCCAIAYNLVTSCTEWRWLIVESVLEAVASKGVEENRKRTRTGGREL